MGKKNFVEDYDPLKAHLTRDLDRTSVKGASRAAPVVRAESDADTQPEADGPVAVTIPQRSPGGGGGGASLVPRKAQPRAAAVDASPEMSARIKLSAAAFQDLEAMLANVHRATGSKVHYSIVTRALWGLLVQAESQVIEEVRKAEIGRLPSTRGRLEYAEYEEGVKQALAAAFRKLPRSLFQSIGHEPQEVDSDR